MKKKIIKVGDLKLGGNNPIVIKGMLKSSLDSQRKVLREAKDLEKEGCQILRVAIENEKDAKIIEVLKSKLNIPIEADIHFDYRLALLSIEKNVDCIRLNPLNIYKNNQIKKIAKIAKERNIPIRVGVNSGGFKKRLSSSNLAYALVNKLLSYIKILEKFGFSKIMLSAKAYSPQATILANRLLYKKLVYPIHLGLTATGPYFEGLIKSSLTLGVLLYQGIGNALRMSLNSDSLSEVRAAKWILQSLGLRYFYPEIISCPTCSRCKVNLRKKVEEFKEIIYKYKNKLHNRNIRLALMGCPVNGPGEAACADLGIAFGKRLGVLFKRGKIIKRIKEKDSLNILMDFLGSVK